MIHKNSFVALSSDKTCKLVDLSTQKVISKIIYETIPLKAEVHSFQQFFIVTDHVGNIFFHDFRERIGPKRLVDSTNSLITCIIQNDNDVILFDKSMNSRLIDFRTNQIVLDKYMTQIVNCGVPTKDPQYVIIADTDLKLVNKLSLEVKLFHKIDKGTVYTMGREGKDIFTGGFDKELKVF